MSQRRVRWTLRASKAVESALSFIAQDNRAAAELVAEKIWQTAQKLGERPIGRTGRLSGTYEKTVVGLPYILCYTLNLTTKGQEEIIILHVIHTARHWPKGTMLN